VANKKCPILESYMNSTLMRQNVEHFGQILHVCLEGLEEENEWSNFSVAFKEADIFKCLQIVSFSYLREK
jgi:hypothetical protein